MDKLNSVKGMHDILPVDTLHWQNIEAAARRVFALYGFGEIRTPVLEQASLFSRSVGADSDIVSKEMYSFVDQGDEQLTLRPEGTAPVVRSYIQHNLLQQDSVSKLYYICPMFRRERPQKGRLRQFHQIGAELFGSESPSADVEVITLLAHLLREIGISGAKLEINSIGTQDERSTYTEELIKFLQKVESKLGPEALKKMEKNPLRVFDCKEDESLEILQEAPTILDYLGRESSEHFDEVCKGLSARNVKYVLNPRIVRGLDYYMRTAFEVTTTHLGAQSAICGGGRYDGLVKQLGGPNVPGIGFGIGIERLVLLLEAINGERVVARDEKHVFIAALGSEARRKIIPLIEQLRVVGVAVEWDFDDRSLKAQMKRADRSRASQVIIFGEDELKRGILVLRNLTTKEQIEIETNKLVQHLSALIAKESGKG